MPSKALGHSRGPLCAPEGLAPLDPAASASKRDPKARMCSSMTRVCACMAAVLRSRAAASACATPSVRGAPRGCALGGGWAWSTGGCGGATCATAAATASGAATCGWATAGAVGARAAIRACGSTHRSRRVARRLVAQVVLGPHQLVALLARGLPVQQERGREVRSIEQGHGVIHALQLRRQAQLAAVHAADPGVQQFVAVSVHQAGGADLRQGQRSCRAAAAQLLAVAGVSGLSEFLCARRCVDLSTAASVCLRRTTDTVGKSLSCYRAAVRVNRSP